MTSYLIGAGLFSLNTRILEASQGKAGNPEASQSFSNGSTFNGMRKGLLCSLRKKVMVHGGSLSGNPLKHVAVIPIRRLSAENNIEVLDEGMLTEWSEDGRELGTVVNGN